MECIKWKATGWISCYLLQQLWLHRAISAEQLVSLLYFQGNQQAQHLLRLDKQLQTSLLPTQRLNSLPQTSNFCEKYQSINFFLFKAGTTLTRADGDGNVTLIRSSRADGGTKRSPFFTAPLTKIVRALGKDNILKSDNPKKKKR